MVKRTSTGGGGAVSSPSAGNTAASDDLLLTERTERVESTIVSRENATHAAFAASRTVDFGYAPSPQYIRLLNDFCSGADPSSLLVVVGPPGSGKSALLAHWAAQRRLATAEDSGGGGGSAAGHEFIYEHYCGCSFDSVKLSLFLFRLMNQLKITYGLRDFELPHEHEEEKLKFSFARCLEAAVGRASGGENQRSAATKERRIVLILDGIDCIRTEDGGDSLSWLPNTFPPGVRLVVSATHASAHAQCALHTTRKPVAYDADGDLVYDTSLPATANDSHAIRELRRRQTTFVLVEPLDEAACRSLVLQCTGGGLADEDVGAVVALPGSANPLYLRLLLQARSLFDTPTWLDKATSCLHVHEVYELVLRRWNELLLQDLRDQLDRLTAEAAVASIGHGRALQRRATKRDVTSDHHGLQRTPSSSSSHQLVPTTTISSTAEAEIETLQTAMEQRALLVRHTLSLLTVARYGLSASDLARLLGDAVPRATVDQLLTLLAPHVMRIRRRDCDASVELLDLSHNALRLLVRYGFLRDDTLRGSYYRELASYFGGLEASQRRVDELPVQLERCGQWAALQAALVDIRMFQLWWHERNRQEFFSYWLVLRGNCSVHDPVDDFVKSLDDYLVHESPSAKQLLSLCLTITDFLRTWQRIDSTASSSSSSSSSSTRSSLVLARPPPPLLHEFLASLGHSPSTAGGEAKRVQAEVDALVLHTDDAYFVRRWLWTQFPLVAVAFESRFLHSNNSSAVPPDKPPSISATKERDSDKPPPPVLPKTLGRAPTLSTKKPTKPQHKLSPSPSKDWDSLPETDATFEFLSPEHTALSVGSVSKCETQLVALRARYDKLQFALRERQAAAASLESRLLDARVHARAAGQSAGQLDALLEQVRVVTLETQAGRQRGDYYRAILRHCEIHPARDANAIETTETAVNKLKAEVVALQQRALVVAYETRLAAAESRRLEQVIADQAQIHAAALARLRWRHELMQRLAAVGEEAAETEDAEEEVVSGRIDEEEEGGEDGEDENEDGDDAGDDHSGGQRRHGQRPSRRRRSSSLLDSHLSRAKDKLLHKKETTLERLRKSESLKVYVGSPFKDDGVLGALRQVGINKPEEAHLYWHDQQQHAAQLEAEERGLDKRVGELRERLEGLHATYLGLKLGGSGGGDAQPHEPAVVGAAGGGGSGSGTMAVAVSAVAAEPAIGAAAVTHNLKSLEQQLAEAAVVTQQKKERASRLKSLSERLHLGLHHVSQLLGVASTQHMESIELADAVEQVVRLYLGDEGHLQASASTSLRRKNSVRAMGMANQSGLHAFVPPDLRSDDEKVRYNVRVSRSPQRQMNPYVDGEAECEDEQDEDESGAGVDGAGGEGEGGNQEDAVTRRADIKNRARLEIERKLRTPVAKEKSTKRAKPAAKSPA